MERGNEQSRECLLVEEGLLVLELNQQPASVCSARACVGFSVNGANVPGVNTEVVLLAVVLLVTVPLVWFVAKWWHGLRSEISRMTCT